MLETKELRSVKLFAPWNIVRTKAIPARQPERQRHPMRALEKQRQLNPDGPVSATIVVEERHISEGLTTGQRRCRSGVDVYSL